jgi:hypothetical protein
MYTSNRLEWHRDVEQMKLTPQGTVWSCRTASESFDHLFNRLAVALAKSQDHRASCGVFAFGRPSDSRYVTGPAWGDKSRNTDSRTHPLICRTALIERLLKDWVQRWKQGPIHKRINPSSALGAFMFNSNIKPGEGRKDTGLSTLVRPMEKSNG